MRGRVYPRSHSPKQDSGLFPDAKGQDEGKGYLSENLLSIACVFLLIIGGTMLAWFATTVAGAVASVALVICVPRKSIFKMLKDYVQTFTSFIVILRKIIDCVKVDEYACAQASYSILIFFTKRQHKIDFRGSMMYALVKYFPIVVK